MLVFERVLIKDKMETKIKTIPFKSLIALAVKLNSEISNGRAVQFHNNGGVFVRNTEDIQHQLILKLSYKDHPQSNAEHYAYGLMFREAFQFESDFFKICRYGEKTSDFRLLKQLGINPNMRCLSFGPRLSVQELPAHGNMIRAELDSSEYGPLVGMLSPLEGFDKMFGLRGEERVYWKRH